MISHQCGSPSSSLWEVYRTAPAHGEVHRLRKLPRLKLILKVRVTWIKQGCVQGRVKSGVMKIQHSVLVLFKGQLDKRITQGVDITWRKLNNLRPLSFSFWKRNQELIGLWK